MNRLSRAGIGGLAVLVLFGLFPATVWADPFFERLRDKAADAIPIIAGLLAMVAAVVVGGIAYYGSNNTGKWVGKFIVGTIFILAATLGTELLPALKEFFGIGR